MVKTGQCNIHLRTLFTSALSHLQGTQRIYENPESKAKVLVY